ncbi:hypothetical protein [Microbispora rosea]|uniref:hypothetical protein n=1 Tax=Microbispora rosea TaxID=58117 RepID=UPI00344ADDE7
MRSRAEGPAIDFEGRGGWDHPSLSVVASNAHGTSDALGATANHARERRFFPVGTGRA